MTDLQKIEFQKSLQKIKDNKQLEYFKNELIKILETRENKISKAIEDYDKSIAKTFRDEFGIEKAGYGIGTVRVWKGQKFRKIAPGKWRRIYDSNTRGASQSIAILTKKIQNASSIDELLQLVMENTNRFMDSDGKLLPIVEKLQSVVKESKGKLNANNNSRRIRFDKDFNELLTKGQKKWNNGPVDFDFSEEQRKDIAFNLHITERDVDNYVRNARKNVNDYLSAKDTEIVHYDRSELLTSDDFWNEPRLKSAFESKRSLASGVDSRYLQKRNERENELLEGSNKIKNEHRPIYSTAVKDGKIFEEGRGDYGNVAIVLDKDKLKDRISYTIGDTLNHETYKPFQKDFGTALSKQNDTVRQLKNYSYLFNNKGELVDKWEYIEAQIWGGIDFKKGDVKAIILNKKTIRDDALDRVNKLIEHCNKYNIDVRIQEEWK